MAAKTLGNVFSATPSVWLLMSKFIVDELKVSLQHRVYLSQMTAFAELFAALSGIAAVPGMRIPPWKLSKRFKRER